MELLEQVESYLSRTRTPHSTFGRTVLSDPRFVNDLRCGRKPRQQTRERVLLYLSSHQWTGDAEVLSLPEQGFELFRHCDKQLLKLGIGGVD